MGGYEIYELNVGLIYDVASSVEDLVVYYRVESGPDGKVRKVRWKNPNVPEEEEEGEKESKEIRGGKSEEKSMRHIKRRGS